MPALNFIFAANRLPDAPGYQSWQLSARPADPIWEYSLGPVGSAVYVGTPADPPNLVYATLADAVTAFTTDQIVNNAISGLNSVFGTSFTLGVLLAYPQPVADAIASVAASIVTPSSSMVSRSLNTAFQPSSTRSADVSFSIDITTALTLTGGQSGSVFLEMASNSGFTGTVTTLDEYTASNTGALTVGLSLSQVITAKLGALNVSAGSWLRLRTANNTGSPTFTYKRGRETLR